MGFVKLEANILGGKNTIFVLESGEAERLRGVVPDSVEDHWIVNNDDAKRVAEIARERGITVTPATRLV